VQPGVLGLLRGISKERNENCIPSASVNCQEVIGSLGMGDNEPPSSTCWLGFFKRCSEVSANYFELLSTSDISKPDNLIQRVQMSLEKGEHSISLLCKNMHVRNGTLKKRFEEARQSVRAAFKSTTST
jgi:hypothetical protein